MDEAVQVSTEELPILDPRRVTLQRDAFSRLVLKVGDETHEAVRPVRCYPLSEPDRYIGFFAGVNEQIGLIEDIGELDAASREVLADELALTYLTTHVRSIQSVASQHGLTTWEFDTDRGPRTVYVKDRHDIRRIPPRRVIFTDVHDMRFEVTDTAQLDPRSAALLGEEV